MLVTLYCIEETSRPASVVHFLASSYTLRVSFIGFKDETTDLCNIITHLSDA